MRMDPAAPPPGHRGGQEDDATLARSAQPAQKARRCPSCQQTFSGEARFCPFDGDPLIEAPDYNPAADPLIGQIIDGRYQVVSVIGEGGMGTVYEVRHTTLGRRFALKVLRRDIADAEHIARFIQEAKAAAGIGHPNIVAVSDFGELSIGGASPVPFFVMEYLSGVSLAALLRSEKTLPPVRAAEIVRQCAAGLAAAHAAGVIHRDLKPDNVFLTRSSDREFVKLLDFGVAKMVGAGRLTRAGMVFGTPHYMSPEQAAGQPVDHRADIYALGVILYEMLAGKVPFEADTYMGVLTKHMFATPEPLDRVVPDASRLGPLGAIAMRCLSKNAPDRYASMAELVAAIDEALEAPRLARSDRPRRRALDTADSLAPSGTPGLKPVVGPVGIGIGIAVAAVLALVVVLREVRGSAGQAQATATAAPTVTATAATSAPAPATATATAAAPDTATAAASASAPPPTATAAATTPTPPRTARPAGPKSPGGKSRSSGGEVVDPWGR
jgi:serine/threonine-protein kinase